jgi:hypothetical protein
VLLGIHSATNFEAVTNRLEGKIDDLWKKNRVFARKPGLNREGKEKETEGRETVLARVS